VLFAFKIAPPIGKKGDIKKTSLNPRNKLSCMNQEMNFLSVFGSGSGIGPF